MCHPLRFWLKIQTRAAGTQKRKSRRDRERDRSTVICNVSGMTRREQLNVAGCSCKRLRHRSYFATLISLLGGVSSPRLPPPLFISSISLFLHLRLSRPFRNFSAVLFSSAAMIGVVVGRRLHSALARRQLLRLFTIRERCNDVLRPRVYARATVRERAMFFLKNIHDSLIKSHDPIPPFRILRWCVQHFIVCRSGSIYRLADPRLVSPKVRRIKNTVYLMVNDRLLEQVSARYTRSPCPVVWRENKLII